MKSKTQNLKSKTGAVRDAILEGLGHERFAKEARLRAEYRSQPEGFIRWCEDETYVLDAVSNRWQPFRFDDWQLVEVRKVLDPDPARFRTIVWCWPRRHGKSEVASRYDIWRCKNFDFQNVVIGSNSEDQTLSTAYQIAVDTIRNSPKLRAELDAGEIVILANEIKFHRTHSTITGIPTREASAYGQKINVGHVTELCKAFNDSLYQVIASSTGDAHMGVAVCDSNVGSIDNIVWRLIQLAESGEDPTIAVSYVHYQDLDEAIRRGPRWISADWLRSRSRQMTPGEFRRNHLNLPATVGAKLFTEFQVNWCFGHVPKGWDGAALPTVFSADEFQRLRSRCALYGVLSRCGGLDRALPWARQDRTFWALVAKMLVETPAGEVPVYDDAGKLVRYERPDPYAYVLLNLHEAPWSNAAEIQRAIESDVDRYGGVDYASIEQYQAADIHEWCLSIGIPAVLTHFTGPCQLQAYSEFYRIVVSGRFFASAGHAILKMEMQNIQEDSSGKLPAFGGPETTVADDLGNRVRIKDDSVEAVIHTVIAARGELQVPQGPPTSTPHTSVFARAY